MSSAELYVFNCRIERVVDGDTVDVTIDLGFDVWLKERVRLHGVNTPELNSSDLDERVRAKEAKVFVEGLLPVGTLQLLESIAYRRGKYGRVLGRFITGDGEDVNQAILDRGLGTPYP